MLLNSSLNVGSNTSIESIVRTMQDVDDPRHIIQYDGSKLTVVDSVPDADPIGLTTDGKIVYGPTKTHCEFQSKLTDRSLESSTDVKYQKIVDALEIASPTEIINLVAELNLCTSIEILEFVRTFMAGHIDIQACADHQCPNCVGNFNGLLVYLDTMIDSLHKCTVKVTK